MRTPLPNDLFCRNMGPLDRGKGKTSSQWLSTSETQILPSRFGRFITDLNNCTCMPFFSCWFLFLGSLWQYVCVFFFNNYWWIIHSKSSPYQASIDSPSPIFSTSLLSSPHPSYSPPLTHLPLSSEEMLGGTSQQFLCPATMGQCSIWLLSDVLQHPVSGAAAGQRLPVPTLRPWNSALEPPAAQLAGWDQAARRWCEPIRIAVLVLSSSAVQQLKSLQNHLTTLW